LTSIRKIDPDWFVNKEEALAAVDGIIEADLPFLVIFLHSDSLLAGLENAGLLVEDHHTRDIFQAMLNRIEEKRLRVVTMRDLAMSETLVATLQNKDVLPRVTVYVDLHRYLWHWLRTTDTVTQAAGVALLTCFAGGALWIVAFRRRRAGWSITQTGEYQQ